MNHKPIAFIDLPSVIEEDDNEPTLKNISETEEEDAPAEEKSNEQSTSQQCSTPISEGINFIRMLSFDFYCGDNSNMRFIIYAVHTSN